MTLVHGRALHSAFHFDDEHSLLQNPHVRSLPNLPRFFTDPGTFSRNPESAMYRPLVLASYALNYRWGGYGAQGYHAVNLGIHAAVCALVWVLFRHLGAGSAAALAGALAFGVHPLTGEPVHYVSSRSESLAALFVLAAFALHVGRRCGARITGPACFALGLLAKPTALALPLLLLLHEGCWARRPAGRWWVRHVPYWGIAALYLGGTRALLQEALVTQPVRPLLAHWATQVEALAYYVKLLFLPHPLTVEHQFFAALGWSGAPVLAGVLLVLSLAGLAASRAGRRTPAAFWLGWMAVCLLPTLVVPLNVLVSERRLYLPLVGCVGLVVWLVDRASARPRPVLCGSCLVLVPLLGLLSAGRSGVWASEASLWEEAARRAPRMVRPHLRLGSLHRQQGRPQAAEAEVRRALELDPHSGPAWNNLANLLQETGRPAEAETAYGRALSLAPRYPEALVNLASLRSQQGDAASAVALCQRALAVDPWRAEAHHNLGTALLRLGRFAEAEAALRRAVELDPVRPQAWCNLGGALEGQGRLGEAESSYAAAVERDAGYAQAYYHLGRVCQARGEGERARAAYTAFLERWQGEAAVAAEVGRRLEGLGGPLP
ncbi:MAG: tetratricopeptide repeat protein [Candidatus Latescibacterota bacterium]